MGCGQSRIAKRPPRDVGLTQSIIQQMRLSRTSRLNLPSRWYIDRRQSAGVGGVEAHKHLVRGVLQASARFVQHPGSLARQLAELVAIGHVRECPKYQIRTHKVILLPDLSAWHYLVPAVR